MATQTHTLDLCRVLRESSRIIKARGLHFLVLSAIFLLPLSFFSIIYPTLSATFPQPNSLSHHHDHAIVFFLSNASPQCLNQSLLLPVLFSFFSIFLSLCSIATITYTTIHGFHGKPVTIISSLKTLLFYFPRLFSTFVVSEIILLLVCLLVVIVAILIFEAFELLGFAIDYDSMSLTWGVILVTLLLIALLVWIQLNWALSFVVVVAEDKWGYKPLRRSAYLIKGMRGLEFTIMLLFFVLAWIPLCGWWIPVVNADGVVNVWRIVAIILQTCFLALLMLYNEVVNAIMYNYCMALHGELVLDQTVEDSAGEYVSLPVDDDTGVPRVVPCRGQAQE